MEKKFTKFLKPVIENLFYLFVFLLPWQTKIILRSVGSNFNEISLYLSHLLLLLILALFFIYKIERREQDAPVSRLWMVLACLELAILASFFVASDQILAFYYYVIFLAAIALFYLLYSGLNTFNYEEPCLDKMKVLFSFLSGILLQASFGIYQFLNQQTPAYKYLGLASHDANMPGASVVEAVSGRWLRAYGGFDHPNIFGGVLAISLLITSYLLANKKVIRSAKEMLASFFLFFSYFIYLLALFFTFSRASWLAFSLGLLYFFVFLLFKKDYWIFGRFVFLILFSALMIFIVAKPYSDLLVARVDGSTRLELKSLNDRKEYLLEARDIIKDNWLLGVGPGNYVSAIAKNDNYKKAVWDYQPVHNVFLLLWAQSGLFSLIAFIVFMFLLKKESNNVYSGAILTALIALMLFDHWLFSLPFGIIFLFLIFGLM